MRACRSTCTTSTESTPKTATVLLRCETTAFLPARGLVDAGALPAGAAANEISTSQTSGRTRSSKVLTRGTSLRIVGAGLRRHSAWSDSARRSRPSRLSRAARRSGRQVRGRRRVQGADVAPVPSRRARRVRARSARGPVGRRANSEREQRRRLARLLRAVPRRMLRLGTAGRRLAVAARVHRVADASRARGCLARRRRARRRPARPRQR